MTRKFLLGRGLVLGSVLMAALVFAGCKKDKDQVQTPVAGLMAFNLVADQPAVSIALSGNLLPGGPLSYTSFTGRYLNVFPGIRVVESVNPATNQVLDSLSYTFEPGKYYSVFVVGANNSYQNIVSVDNYDSLTASSGKAYVRYVNGVSGTSAANITLSSGGTSVVNASAPFGQVSDFVAVNPGDLGVGVSAEGADASRTLHLEEHKAYTVLLVGQPGATDSSKTVQIRFIENGTVTD
jgi:hypothetical protein